jgi:hypothetical protein
MTGWQAVAQTACLEAKLPPLQAPASSVPKPKTRIELTSASRQHGFQLISEHCDEYLTPIGFGVDYQAMDPDWPVKGYAQGDRHALLTKMQKLAQGKFETMVSTRFLFRRTVLTIRPQRNGREHPLR